MVCNLRNFKKILPGLIIVISILSFFVAVGILSDGGIGRENLPQKEDLGSLYEEFNKPYASRLKKLYGLAVVTLASFSAVSIIAIWKHSILEIQKGEPNQESFLDSKYQKVDYGLLWFALAIMIWEISGLIDLGFINFPIHSGLEDFIKNTISSLNNLFLLLAVRTFHLKETELSGLIGHLNKLRVNARFLIGFCFITITLTYVFTLFPILRNEIDKPIHIPNLIFSSFTIILLFLFFEKIFEERGIYFLRWLVWITLIAAFLAQSVNFLELNPEEPKFNTGKLEAYYFLLLSFKTWLVLMIYGIAYSWVIFLHNQRVLAVNRKLKTNNNKIKNQNREIEKQSKHLKEVKREMNHAVKNSLQFIQWDLERKLYYLKSENHNIQYDLIINEVLVRIVAALALHETLYSSNPSYQEEGQKIIKISLDNFLQNVLNKLSEVLSIDQSCYLQTEISVSRNLITADQQASNIATIIVEAVFNSYKAYQRANNFTLVSQIDPIYLKIKESSSYLIIEIVDQAGGFDVDSVEYGYGINYMRRTCKLFDGELNVISNGSGTSVIAKLSKKSIL